MGLLTTLLLAVLLVKAGAYLLRWYQVTGEAGFPDVGPADRVRQLAAGTVPFLREYGATLVTYGIWCAEAPVRALLRRRLPPVSPAPPEATPVILVHGFFMTPWSLWFLWLRLRREGVGPLYLLDYQPMLGPIEGFADQLAALIERVAGADGAGRPVDVVAHSMGGLVAARCMADHPGRVRRLVTIGTPFHGTRLWAMSVGRSLPQMRPGSAFLAGTVERPGFPGPTALTSLYSRFDQIILPHTSSRVERAGARNVELDGLGHNALLISPRVARLVRDALADDRPGLPRVAGTADKEAGAGDSPPGRAVKAESVGR